MANHKSAQKRARQTETRTAVNTARRSRVRGSVKKVEEAIATGDKKAAQAALRAAQPEIQRGAIKRIVTKNAAARRVSRLSRAHQGDGLILSISFSGCERRSHERRFLLSVYALGDILSTTEFAKKIRAHSTKNIWSPIGRTTYDSRLSPRVSAEALDIERRRAHRAAENRFDRVVNRVARGTV